jgi:hypothetical protein
MTETNLENLEVPTPGSIEVLGDTPETPAEKQVTMTQASLDALIKSRQAAALKKAAALETENQRLREVAAGQSADSSELEKIRGELAAAKIERDAISAAAAQSKKESFVAQQVQKQGFVCDAHTLLQLTQNDLQYDEAAKTFVTADGTSADDYFKRFADARPYLVRSTVHAGTGQSGSVGTTPPATKPLSFYFGAHSSAAAVNRLSIEKPEEYRRLRREAISQGLISGGR